MVNRTETAILPFVGAFGKSKSGAEIGKRASDILLRAECSRRDEDTYAAVILMAVIGYMSTTLRGLCETALIAAMGGICFVLAGVYASSGITVLALLSVFSWHAMSGAHQLGRLEGGRKAMVEANFR